MVKRLAGLLALIGCAWTAAQLEPAHSSQLLFAASSESSQRPREAMRQTNSVNEPTTLYVVTRSTQKFKIGGRDNPSVGLFTTTDRGVTWQHWGWHYEKCFSVAIAPGSDGRTLYLSCGNGVLKSGDGGANWIIATDWRMTECLKAAVDPQNPQIVYAATAYGIFKTSDGGARWEEKNGGLHSTFTPIIAFDVDNPKVLYCATEAGVFYSDNGAERWELLGLKDLGIRALVQHATQSNLLIAGTEDNGVMISQDRGKSWQASNAGLGSLTIYSLALDTRDPAAIYAGTFRAGVFKSLDGGKSWTSSNVGLTTLDIHAILVDPSDSDVIYCGTLGGGVFLSEDGGASWRFIGLETSQVWDFAVSVHLDGR